MGQRAFRIVAGVLGLVLVLVVGAAVAIVADVPIPWINPADSKPALAEGQWEVPAGAVPAELTQSFELQASGSCPGGTFMAPATASFETILKPLQPGNTTLWLDDSTYLLVVINGTTAEMGDASARALEVVRTAQVPISEPAQAYTIGDKTGVRYQESFGRTTVSDWQFDIGPCGYVIGVLAKGDRQGDGPSPELYATAAAVVASFTTT